MKVTFELEIWQAQIMARLSKLKADNYYAHNPCLPSENSTEYEIQLVMNKFFEAIPTLENNLTEKLTKEIKEQLEEELEDERQADRDDIESEIKEEIFYNVEYTIKKIKEILKKKKLGGKKIKVLRGLIKDIELEIA